MSSAATQPQPLQCEAHGAVAGWECANCHRPLCPDCAATKVMYPATVVACVPCGGLAEELVRAKSETASLAQRLPGAFTFFLTVEGVAAWLGVALWVWLTSFAGLGGLFFGWGGAIAALFGLTRSTANGKDHLELSDFQDPLSSMGLPLIRFAVAMLPAWGGALLALETQRPWLLWLSLALTIVWSPTAFIGAATNASFVDMLNPLRVLKASAALGKDFAVYVGSLFAVGVVLAVSVPLSWAISHFLWVPVLSGVLSQMVLLYAPLVGARIAGLVLFLHGPVFGWGDSNERYEPILKGVEPRGVLPETRVEQRSHAPLELEPEPVVLEPAGLSERFGALEVDRAAEAPPEGAVLDVSLLPSHAEQNAQVIREAIRAGNHGAALDGFRATGLTAKSALTFDELVWLGQTASSHIDYESAELAFRAALERGGAPEPTNRTRVMLARLLGERLSRRDEGRALMEVVCREAPGTSAATFATQWLASH